MNRQNDRQMYMDERDDKLMDEQMGWMHEWMGGCIVNGWMEGQLGGCVDIRIGERVDGWVGEWLRVWMDRWTGGYVGGWKNGQPERGIERKKGETRVPCPNQPQELICFLSHTQTIHGDIDSLRRSKLLLTRTASPQK